LERIEILYIFWIHFWWECKRIILLWKAVWQFLKKSNIHLLYNPEIELLGFYQKKTETKQNKKPNAICPYKDL